MIEIALQSAKYSVILRDWNCIVKCPILWNRTWLKLHSNAPNVRGSYETKTAWQLEKYPGNTLKLHAMCQMSTILCDWNCRTMCQMSRERTWLKLHGKVLNVRGSYVIKMAWECAKSPGILGVSHCTGMCQLSGDNTLLKLKGNVRYIRGFPWLKWFGNFAKSTGILRDWNCTAMSQLSDDLMWLKLNGDVPHVRGSYLTQMVWQCTNFSGDLTSAKLNGNVGDC